MLKLGAASLASVIGISGSVHAADPKEERYDELIRAGQQILEQQGPKARDKFLEKHGFVTTRTTHEYDVPAVAQRKKESSSGNVSTENVDCIDPTNCNGDISLSLGMSYWRYNNIYHVDLSARFRYEYYTVSGYPYEHYYGPENPLDGFGITWEKDHWALSNYDPGNTKPANAMTESSYVDWDNGSWNRQGTGFTLDDQRLCKDSGTTGSSGVTSTEQWSNWTSGGVDLRPSGEWTEGDTVCGIYTYTWNDSSVDFSVGVSYPYGISLSASTSTSMNSQDLQTNINGTNLAVTINEIN